MHFDTRTDGLVNLGDKTCHRQIAGKIVASGDVLVVYIMLTSITSQQAHGMQSPVEKITMFSYSRFDILQCRRSIEVHSAL